jgi:predicted N-acyltransferase
MRKTFQIRPEGKNPDRTLEAVKHEIRKYIQRERRRVLPKGVDFWDFDCRFGATEEAATVVHLGELTKLMDAVAQAAGPQFYVEILAKHGHHPERPAASLADPAQAKPDASA